MRQSGLSIGIQQQKQQRLPTHLFLQKGRRCPRTQGDPRSHRYACPGPPRAVVRFLPPLRLQMCRDVLSCLPRVEWGLLPGRTGVGPLTPTLSGIGALGFHRETLFLSTSGVTHGACDLFGSGADKYNFCSWVPCVGCTHWNFSLTNRLAELVREPGKELAAVPVHTHTHTHTHTLTPAPGTRATARAGRLAWQTAGPTEPRAAFRTAESLWCLGWVSPVTLLWS